MYIGGWRGDSGLYSSALRLGVGEKRPIPCSPYFAIRSSSFLHEKMKGASFLRVSSPPSSHTRSSLVPHTTSLLLNSYASCGKFGFANTCKSHHGRKKEKKWSVDEVNEPSGRWKTKKEIKIQEKIYTIQSENNNSVKRKAYFVGGGRAENSEALLFNQLGCSKLEWRWETRTLSK